MSRRSLLTVFAVASIGLAACGGADPATDVAAPAPTTTTAPDTSSPAVEDEGPGTDVVPARPADDQAPAPAPQVEDEGPGTDVVPAAPADQDGTPVSPVTLAFDGRAVPIATQCTGADGAILATTQGEVTITLVREDGLSLRYAAEGTRAETDEVAVRGGTDTTTYTATLSSDDVAPVEVTMVVMDDATAALEAC